MIKVTQTFSHFVALPGLISFCLRGILSHVHDAQRLTFNAKGSSLPLQVHKTQNLTITYDFVSVLVWLGVLGLLRVLWLQIELKE